MLNLLTTITNITAYYPIRTSLSQGDLVTAAILIYSAGTSAISHLFESHKHGLWGFGVAPKISYFLNRLDLTGVTAVLARFVFLWQQSGLGTELITQHPSLFTALFFSWLCNVISEQDTGYYYFFPFHCLWHLTIFLIIDEYLHVLYRPR